MISNLECAILSGFVYQNYAPVFEGLIIGKTECGLPPVMNGWAWATDVDSSMSVINDCYAGLFIKFEQGVATEAVVAIRGTVVKDLTDVLVDFMSWHPDALGDGRSDDRPFFYHTILNFVMLARSYLQRYFPSIVFSLKLTGHSLGGALAQMITLVALPLETLVFNSPGCGHMMGIDLEHANLITNINARYGVINKVGKIVGHVHWVDVPEEEPEAKALYQHYELDKKLAGVFSSDDVFVRVGLMLDAVESMPNVQVGDKVCDAANPHWFDLFNRIGCHEKILGTDVAEVIIAQHSIINMISSLRA